MKNKIPLEEARRIAQKYVSLLSPHAERIEIAGSIRRGKPEVGDIEIVAIPEKVMDMFGIACGYWEFSLPCKLIKGGDRYKQFELPEGLYLDLFVVIPPAQWGVIFALRTGSAEFSHRLVSPRPWGYLPEGYYVKDGCLYCDGELIPTPEEEDFLKVCGVAHKSPAER
jgi:DNA polymerase/3'-5' exonuclease PolX